MSNLRIGVVGQGFVGGSFTKVMRDWFNIETYDLNPELRTTESISELVSKSNIIFVAVPTPMFKDGSCDTRIVQSVLQEIHDAVEEQKLPACEVVVRSTIPPGSTLEFNVRFNPHINVIFNPEFLREVTAEQDFRSQDRIVLGVPSTVRDSGFLVQEVYRQAFPSVVQVVVSCSTAEMVKYTTNVFLATKVSLANELYQICDALDINYDVMVDVATLDKRLGDSHWMVPGPPMMHDERRLLGWGGSCFVKDLNALKSLGKSLDVKTTMMDAAWEKNLEVRTGDARDWEKLKGRAISDE